MSVSGLFSSIADKAQSVLSSGQPSTPGQAQGGGGYSKSHALESIQHQLRTIGQQYASTTPIQKIITNGKGVAIDFDSVSQDAKAQSKELYTWGQGEVEDLKDVSDRLAYLNFVQGSLAHSLALKLDEARAPLKALRDLETSLSPRRNIRSGLELQIARIEHDQAKGIEQKLAQLKEQLKKAQHDDEPSEKQVELLKRKALRESEKIKWEAIREYGEKLALLSQAATPIITALPTFPPTAEQPYKGTESTGAARASLQRALDNYKPGSITLPPPTPASDLSRSDTRSFGESHASELSSIGSSEPAHTVAPGIPITPPTISQELPKTSTPAASEPQKYNLTDTHPSSVQSPAINPATLNFAPAPIPAAAVSASPTSPANVSTTVTPILPTVAETGVPLTAGADGPGPASGSLRDLRAAWSTAGPRSGGLQGNESQVPGYGQGLPGTAVSGGPVSTYESAEDEKKRLQREERERVLGSSSVPSTTAKYESAEDEKKRLQREEREKLLHTGGTKGGGDAPKKGGDDDLPPYQDF